MSEAQKNWMLGCDWGTSSFRIRLVDTARDLVVRELISKEGVACTFNEWQEQSSSDQSRYRFFLRKLTLAIDTLSQQVSIDLGGLPVVVTGMASSSIGMAELPYADLPFSLTADEAVVRWFDSDPDFNHPLLLVSGIRDKQDVMRGEEVQLIGLMNLLKIPLEQETLIILPGTHSKHCLIRNNMLVRFQTYMTGELFKLMSQHSILKDSVILSEAAQLTPAACEAFIEGVRFSQQSELLYSLFTVRTNSLFDRIPKKSNAYYLSGLLIGQELGYLVREKKDWLLVVCGETQLHSLYMMAMDGLNLLNQVQVLPEGMEENATIKGQTVLLKQLSKALKRLPVF